MNGHYTYVRDCALVTVSSVQYMVANLFSQVLYTAHIFAILRVQIQISVHLKRDAERQL